MRENRRGKHMTQKDFEQIKNLIGYGLNNKQLRDITKRAGSTIYYVKKSSTFEEYKKMCEKAHPSKPAETPPAFLTTETINDKGVKPTVGMIVHYVSYGTPGGEYKSECRAAIITKVFTSPDLEHFGKTTVCLAVLNPEGMFFNQLVQYNDNPRKKGDLPTGGTWHWPEREDG